MLQNKVKAIRDDIKDSFTTIQDQYFFKGQTYMAHDIGQTYPVIKALVNLVTTFMEDYKEAKSREEYQSILMILNIYALNILVTDKWGRRKDTSSAAIQLQDKFSEILIDEYQEQ